MPIIFWPTGQGAGAAGSCDYPAVGDVQEGVTYGSGAYTGTLELPAAGDVRQGTGYGAGGTEFTGTMYAVSNGTGVLLDRLKLIVRVLRDKNLIRRVMFHPRTTGDSYGTAEEFEAYRLPNTSGDANGLSSNRAQWALYKIAGQSASPSRLGKIVVIANSETWHVQSVRQSYTDATLGSLHFLCDCVKEV